MKRKVFCTSVILLIFASVSFSQWQSMNGPYGGFINDLKGNQFYQFAATPNGVFRSADKGATWTSFPLEAGKTIAALGLGTTDSLVVVDAVDISGEDITRRLFFSEDHGEHFAEIDRPASDYPFTVEIAITGIYLHNYGQVYFSPDRGKTWVTDSLFQENGFLSNWAQNSQYVFVGDYQRIYRHNKSTLQWDQIPLPDNIANPNTLYADDDVLFLIDSNNERLYRSRDTAQTWEYMDQWAWKYSCYIVRVGERHYAWLNHHMRYSTNFGQTWQPIALHNDIHPSYMIATDSVLMLGTLGNGIHTSTDLGRNFFISNEGLASALTYSLLLHNDDLLVGNDLGVNNFDFTTSTWRNDFPGQLNRSPKDLIVYDNSVYASAGGCYEFHLDTKTWEAEEMYNYHSGGDFHQYGARLFCGGILDILSVTDLHFKETFWNTWIPFTFIHEGNTIRPSILTSDGQYAYTSDTKTIYRSTAGTNHWEEILPTFPVDSTGYARIFNLISIDSTLFAVYHDPDTYTGYLFKSLDHGDTWISAVSGLPDSGGMHERSAQIKSVYPVNDHLVACTYYHGVYISDAIDIHWIPFNEGIRNMDIYEVIADNAYVYASTWGFGVFRRPISEIISTSTKEEVHPIDCIVYPNPADQYISIQLKEDVSGILQLLDATGKIVHTQPITDLAFELTTRHLAAGTYFLHIRSGPYALMKKVVIVH